MSDPARRVRAVAVTAVVVFAVVAAGQGFVAPAAAATNTAPDCSTVGYTQNASGFYEVTNVSQLQCIENQGLGNSYVLTSDIDASGTDQWNSGDGFNPIGDSSTAFTGTFDGHGHTISNLYIDRGSTDEVGLFGEGDSGTIENITLENVDVTGLDYVGGLVGLTRSSTTIRNTAVTGTVNGRDYYGGLVGSNLGTVEHSFSAVDVDGDRFVGSLVGSNSGTVKQSYATGDADGSFEIGGLVGSSTGNVKQSYATGVVGVNSGSPDRVGGLVGGSGSASSIAASYATGTVSGNNKVGGLVGHTSGGDFITDATVNTSYATGDVSGSSDVGGLVGHLDGTINHSYWDSGTTNQGSAIGQTDGTKKNLVGYGATSDTTPAPEMTGINATVRMTNLDFSSAWRPGDSDDQYPDLAWESGFSGTADAYDSLVAGDGTSGTPYEIEHVYDLQRADTHLDDHFQVQSDIDATATSDATYADGNGFQPLGTFSGTFDGNNNSISNLYISRGGSGNIGLFGQVDTTGTVENTVLDSPDVTGGSDDVGSLVGSHKGTLTRSSVRGGTVTTTTTGDAHLGGLVGALDDGGAVVELSNSSATVDANGAVEVGGLVGDSAGTVRQSYATGDLTNGGGGDVGGLIGDTNSGTTVSEVYAAGSVSGGKGLVGNDGGASVTGAYWDTTATGQSTSAAGTGLTTDEMQGLSATGNMDDMDFVTIWNTVSDDYPALQWQAVAAGEGSVHGIEALDVSELATGQNRITVRATDDVGNEIQGETISVDANDDGLSGISVGDTSDTNTNGNATFIFDEATTGAYTVAFSAEDASITDTATVTIEERYSLSTTSGESGTTLSDAVVVDDQLTIGGPSDDISAARVTLQNRRSGDTLSATDNYGITSTYDSNTGVLALSGTASPAEYQTVLRSVEFQNTNSDDSTDTADREISISLGSSVPSEDTNHYYEFVSDSTIDWDDAKAEAAGKSHFGLQGYLVTVTSQSENDFVASKLTGQGWFGATDRASEGTWKWVTGPEAGDTLPPTGSPDQSYDNWNDGEPNDSGGEDRGHFRDDATWNDYANGNNNIDGYVVEYGGLASDPDVDLRGTKTVTLSDQTDPTYDDASRTDDTTIDITIADNADVNEATITKSDFALSVGTIDSIGVTESGSDTAVTITLAGPVDADAIDVSLVGSIDDTSGNSIASGTRTASNMDGVAPTLDSAARVDDTTIDVTLSEGGSGIDKGSIDSDDFTLDSGSISSIDTSAVTDGATGPQTVTLNLASTVDDDTVTVSLQSDGISDTDGETRTTGSADATGMDAVAPTFDTATRVDDTTIDVTITDGVDVDESTIAKSDFALSDGTIASIGVTESGTDATVTITLASAVDADSIDVDIVGSIDDAAGNALTTGSETVSGTDSVAPSISAVTLLDDTDGNGVVTDGETVELTAAVTDGNSVSAVDADASAFDAGTVTLDDGPNSDASDDQYSATFTVGAGATEGDQSVTVDATDAAGNGGSQAVASTALAVDLTAPTVTDDSGTVLNIAPETILVADVHDNDADNVSPDSALRVTSVGGNTGDVGTTVPGSTGGQFSVNSTGTVTFDPAGDYTTLSGSESATSRITITVADEVGKEGTSTVTASIEGFEYTSGGGGSSDSTSDDDGDETDEDDTDSENENTEDDGSGDTEDGDGDTEGVDGDDSDTGDSTDSDDSDDGLRITVEEDEQDSEDGQETDDTDDAGDGSPDSDDSNDSQSDGDDSPTDSADSEDGPPDSDNSDDGGSTPDRLRVTIEDASDGETARIDRTTTGGTSVGSTTNVSVDSVSMRLAQGRDRASLTITTYEHDVLDGDAASDAVARAARDFEETTGMVSAGYVDVDHDFDSTDLGGVTFEYSARKSYLEDLGVAPADVQLYHRQDDDWTAVETTHVGENETHHRFESSATSFSVFAIGTGARPLALTTTELRTDTVALGEEARVRAWMRNRGTIDREREVTLTADGETVTTGTLRVDGGRAVSTDLAFTPETAGEYDLAVDGQQVGTLTVQSENGTIAETDETDDDAGGRPLWPVGLIVAVVVLGLGAVGYRLR